MCKGYHRQECRWKHVQISTVFSGYFFLSKSGLQFCSNPNGRLVGADNCIYSYYGGGLNVFHIYVWTKHLPSEQKLRIQWKCSCGSSAENIREILCTRHRSKCQSQYQQQAKSLINSFHIFQCITKK